MSFLPLLISSSSDCSSSNTNAKNNNQTNHPFFVLLSWPAATLGRFWVRRYGVLWLALMAGAVLAVGVQIFYDSRNYFYYNVAATKKDITTIASARKQHLQLQQYKNKSDYDDNNNTKTMREEDAEEEEEVFNCTIIYKRNDISFECKTTMTKIRHQQYGRVRNRDTGIGIAGGQWVLHHPYDQFPQTKTTNTTNTSNKFYAYKNRTFYAPICCDNNNILQNPTQCGGKPLQTTRRFHGQVDYYTMTTDNSCRCADASTGRTLLFHDNHVWKPAAASSLLLQQHHQRQQEEQLQQPSVVAKPGAGSASHLPSSLFFGFDKHDFCQRLGNRTILMMGDSSMQQTASTLMNALVGTKCAPQVWFEMADTLVGRRMGKPKVRGRGRWNDTVVRDFANPQLLPAPPDFVVLTAGAHIMKNVYFLQMVNEVLEGMALLWQKFPNMTIVWKTQNPGGCTPDIFIPESPHRAALEFNFSNISGYIKFNHDDFYPRDLYMLSRIQAWNHDNKNRHLIHVLDMRMLYSRSDAHIGSAPDAPLYGKSTRDCLHLCIPGPLDVIAPLFYQLLLRHDTAATTASSSSTLVSQQRNEPQQHG